MISYLKGVVIYSNSIDGTISLLINGVGYLVTIGQKTVNTINIGEELAIFIETITKETGTNLYGFNAYEKAIWFRSLMKVTGVGPKVGINIIDSIPIAELAHAIIDQKPEVLQSIGGLGEKVTNRIISELKKEPAKNAKIFASSKIYTGNITVQQNYTSVESASIEVAKEDIINKNDVVSALVNLGFDYNRSFSIACSVVKGALSLEDAVKNALKQINE